MNFFVLPMQAGTSDYYGCAAHVSEFAENIDECHSKILLYQRLVLFTVCGLCFISLRVEREQQAPR